MKKISVMTDGGSRNNPGVAGIGFVVSDELGSVIYKEGKAIGVATNNVAEYLALIESIKWLQKNKTNFPVPFEITFYSDSELMVNQLTGKYRIKDAKLKPLATQVLTRLAQLGVTYSFHLIPREKNKQADKLVNDALDKLL